MQKNKLQLSLKFLSQIRIFIFLGLCIIGSGISAQTDKTEVSNAPNQDQDQIEEGHDTKNLDNLLKNYNKDKEKVLKDAAKILETDESDDKTNEEIGLNQSNSAVDKDVVLKKSPKNFKNIIDPKTLKKTKYSEALGIALGPLQKMSEKELMALLKENTVGSSASKYIEKLPKLAVFTVRLIKDKDALPSLAKILDDQERLIRFLGIMVSTMLFGFILRRLMKREGRSILKSVSLWFVRFLVISAMRFAIIIFFFSSELAPLMSITKETFF
jgi:hypothetical protein